MHAGALFLNANHTNCWWSYGQIHHSHSNSHYVVPVRDETPILRFPSSYRALSPPSRVNFPSHHPLSHHARLLLLALAARSTKPNTVVVRKGTANVRTEEQKSHTQCLSNHHPSRRHISRLARRQRPGAQLPHQRPLSRLPPTPPHKRIRRQHHIVDHRVRNRGLDLRFQGLAVGFVHALLLEELHGLGAAGGDGGEGGEEAEGEEVVGGAGEVGGGGEVGGDAGGEGEGGEDVDAVGEGEEGDGEVDGCWVDWFAGRFGQYVGGLGERFGRRLTTWLRYCLVVSFPVECLVVMACFVVVLCC